MTWTWRIDINENSHTLVVLDSGGAEVSSTNSDSFTWSGAYPDFVYKTVVSNDAQSALLGDIERAEGLST